MVLGHSDNLQSSMKHPVTLLDSLPQLMTQLPGHLLVLLSALYPRLSNKLLGFRIVQVQGDLHLSGHITIRLSLFDQHSLYQETQAIYVVDMCLDLKS